jgi:SAM-dependent methyltransferase
MEASHLDELIELEDSYWWHVAKRKLVGRLLETYFPPPGILVEGGVGSARNLVEFQQRGYEVHGFDIMPASVEHARSRGLEHVRQHDLSAPWPLAAESVRVAVLLDVLEHMAEPVQVLRNISAVLQPDGGVIVTVPANPWLFGDWDKSLGHFRRYTATSLRRHAAEAELKVEWLSHWNSFSLPAAIAVRGYQRCAPSERKPDFPRVSPMTNRMLLKMASWERRWLDWGTAPFGLSLVGVLRK